MESQARSSITANVLGNIALRGKPAWRYFNLTMARTLKRRCGSAVHIYCTTPEIARFYKEADTDGVFASINVTDTAVNALYEEIDDVEAVYQKAREYEAKIGWTYNSIAVGHRMFGGGYFLGGWGFMQNQHGTQASYVQMVNAVNRTLDYWTTEYREKNIGLVMMGSKEMAVAANVMNIAFRFLTIARFKNYFFWSPNEYYENPKLEAAFQSVEKLDGHDIDEPMVHHLQGRQRFFREVATFSGLVKDSLHLTAQHFYWRLRGYQKARTHKYVDRIRVRIRRWTDWHKVLRKSVTLEELEGKPFVFFPLHIEPEVNLQRVSPEYFYQHALIAAVSRDLPAGYLLAIKEPVNGIGLRPRDFYEQVLAIKNVVMIDPRELGLLTVRQAEATITVAGSAGVEAAVMGKPVITFGKHNNYNFLGHVSVVRDEMKLRDYLKDALIGEFDREKARQDGLKFLQAIVDTSIDMQGYSSYEMDNFDESLVDTVIDSLLADLAEDGHAIPDSSVDQAAE